MSEYTTIASERFDPTTMRISGIALQGDTPFDMPVISEITDNLWMGGVIKDCPLPEFFEHVVSLHPWETYALTRPLKSCLAVMLLDDPRQSCEMVDGIAAWVNTCRAQGPTLVHCQAGLNRSGIVVARALMLDGMSADDAITLLRDQRCPAVLCSVRFEEWLRGL